MYRLTPICMCQLAEGRQFRCPAWVFSPVSLLSQERLVAYQGKLVTVQDVSGQVANGTGASCVCNP